MKRKYFSVLVFFSVAGFFFAQGAKDATGVSARQGNSRQVKILPTQ